MTSLPTSEVVSHQLSPSVNWHLEAIAYYLTRVLEGEIKRLIITIPPRSLKSICGSVCFPAFALGHDPTTRIICVSYAESLARKHANDCRAVMRSDMYNRLFPKTRISSAKDTEVEFATTLGGNRLSTSVGGTLTGLGGNLIIVDDPLKPQDAYSELARDSVKQWYSNTLLSRLDDKNNDAIVVIMQRLHTDDLVGHLLEQEGWTQLNLPAIAESEHDVPLGPGHFHVRRPGDLLHPEREPRTVLDELKRSPTGPTRNYPRNEAVPTRLLSEGRLSDGRRVWVVYCTGLIKEIKNEPPLQQYPLDERGEMLRGPNCRFFEHSNARHSSEGKTMEASRSGM
jgi:hypothetical protein